MLFINICCGIALISVAKFVGEQVIMLSAAAAAFMVMFMSIFNGAGRLVWATISDKIERNGVYIMFFLLQIISFYILTLTSKPMIFLIFVFIIMSCYGESFSNMPALLGDLFGTKKVVTIHGFILTAWAAAGLVGPMLITNVRQTTGKYSTSLYVFIIGLVIALIVTILLALDIRRLKTITRSKGKGQVQNI